MIGALPPACQPLLAEHHCADGPASQEGDDTLQAVLVLDGQLLFKSMWRDFVINGT